MLSSTQARSYVNLLSMDCLWPPAACWTLISGCRTVVGISSLLRCQPQVLVLEDPFNPVNKLPVWKPIFMSQNDTYPLAAWSEICFTSHVPVQAITRINNMLKKAKSVGNDARNVRSSSCDGAWCTEHNDTSFVTVSQILMKWDQFFVITFDRLYSLVTQTFTVFGQ